MIITVLDAGFDSHEDLDPNLRVGLGALYQNNAHGMAVLGIITAQHNSVGISGIVPGAKYKGRRISDPLGQFVGDFTLGQIIEDESNNGSRLMNYSWVSLKASSDFAMPNVQNKLTDQANNTNPIVFIAASGNRGTVASQIKYPARYNETFAVGAIDQNGNRYSYSDYGPELDIVAPSGPTGSDIVPPCGNNHSSQKGFLFKGTIWTLDISGDRGYNPGNFRTSLSEDCWTYYEYDSQPNTPSANNNYHSHFAGTSASTPMVTGVAGLMLSVNPTLPRNQIYNILRNTAQKLPSMNSQNRTDEYGHGLVDAYSAVKEALPEQYDDQQNNNDFSSSMTLGSAHIEGNSTLASGVTLTIPADEVVVIEGSMLGASTNNTHLKVYGKVIIDYDAIISRVFLDVKEGGELLVKPGATFKFLYTSWDNLIARAGGKITAHGTQQNPITFERYDPHTQWGQIGLLSSAGNSFKWVEFDGGRKNVLIASANNTFEHCTFKNAWRGLSGWHNQDGNGPSHATISYSMIEQNTSVGVVAEYLNLEMHHTEIRNNAQAGLYVHSSFVYPFHRNEVIGNGTSYSRDGIEVTSSGNIMLQADGGSQPAPGYNVIKNNSDDQISVSGQATLGLVLNGIGGFNKITGEFIQTGRYLVDNNSGTSVQAKKNYWGQSYIDSRMFDGSLWDEDDILYFDPTSSENPGAGGLHPKTAGPENQFLTISEFYEKHKRELKDARNNSEIRYHLTQMFLASRAAIRIQPEIAESFENYLVQSSDINRSEFSSARLNKSLRDASSLLLVKSYISDADYNSATELIDQISPLTLDGKDRMDYFHAQISTETYSQNYRKAYIALQNYYKVAEQSGMDMNEIRALNSVIEEDLAELLSRQGVKATDIVVESTDVGLSAYPNPFNPSTYISFSIPNQTHVTLTVYDLLGREVASLVNETRNAGSHNVYFDATNLASGVYLYKLIFDNEVITKTMTLIK